MYVVGVLTSSASAAPAICGAASTRASKASGSSSIDEMPTRIAPRSRRCRVSARVSMPLIPTTPCAVSSSSRLRVDRQLLGTRAGIADDVPGHPDAARLGVVGVDAGVADVRGGHHDDLTVVRRVGQRLLVAGHPGGEHRLADRLPRGTVRLAAEGPAVLEYQQRLSHGVPPPSARRRSSLDARRRPPSGRVGCRCRARTLTEPPSDHHHPVRSLCTLPAMPRSRRAPISAAAGILKERCAVSQDQRGHRSYAAIETALIEPSPCAVTRSSQLPAVVVEV